MNCEAPIFRTATYVQTFEMLKAIEAGRNVTYFEGLKHQDTPSTPKIEQARARPPITYEPVSASTIDELLQLARPWRGDAARDQTMGSSGTNLGPNPKGCVCVCVCAGVWVCGCVDVCGYVGVWVCVSVCMAGCLSVDLSRSLSVSMSVCLSVCLQVGRWITRSIDRSVTPQNELAECQFHMRP